MYYQSTLALVIALAAFLAMPIASVPIIPITVRSTGPVDSGSSLGYVRPRTLPIKRSPAPEPAPAPAPTPEPEPEPVLDEETAGEVAHLIRRAALREMLRRRNAHKTPLHYESRRAIGVTARSVDDPDSLAFGPEAARKSINGGGAPAADEGDGPDGGPDGRVRKPIRTGGAVEVRDVPAGRGGQQDDNDDDGDDSRPTYYIRGRRVR